MTMGNNNNTMDFKREKTPAQAVKNLSAPVDKTEKTKVHSGVKPNRGQKTILMLEKPSRLKTTWLQDLDTDGWTKLESFPASLGRDEDCDLVIDDENVSRLHASIEKADGGFVIQDSGSTNGVYVNDHKLQRMLLAEGDVVAIGAKHFRFSLEGQEEKPEASKKVIKGSEFIANRWSGLAAGVAFGFLLVGAGGGYLLSQNRSQPSSGKQEVQVAAVDTAIVSNKTITPEANKPETNKDLSVQNERLPVDKNSADVAHQQSPMQIEMQQEKTEPLEITALTVEPDKVELNKVVEIQAKASISKDTQVASVKPVALEEPIDIQKKVNSSKPKTKTKIKASSSFKKIMDDARWAYLDGNASSAFDLLTRLSTSTWRSRQERDEAKTLNNRLKNIYAEYITGKQAFDSGNRAEAFKQWQAFLIAEQDLYLAQHSSYADEVNKIVLAEYIKAGNNAQAKGNHHEAYKNWQRAAQLQPNGSAASSLANLEKRASDLYRDGYRMETANLKRAKQKWEEVLAMVPPGSEYYIKATAKLRWYAHLNK